MLTVPDASEGVEGLESVDEDVEVSVSCASPAAGAKGSVVADALCEDVSDAEPLALPSDVLNVDEPSVGAAVGSALTSPEPFDEAEDEVVVSAEPEVASVSVSEPSSTPVSSVVFGSVSVEVVGSVESDTARDFLLAMMALLQGV